MARRTKDEGLLDAVAGLVALMPWWAGVTLAVVSYFWLHAVAISPMPVMAGAVKMADIMSGTLWRGFALVAQYVLPLLCVLGAGMSYFKRRQAAQLHSDAANRADGMANMGWQEFEVLVGEYFRRQGFSVTNNGGGGPDGGVDVWLFKGSDRYLVQCKHWRARQVGVVEAREMYGVIAAQRLAGGYLVTSGVFSEEAKAFAEGRELKLINGKALERGVLAQATAAAKTPPKRSSQGPAAVPDASTKTAAQPASLSMPACPNCGSSMTLRVARQGANAGKQFWGCSQFAQTKCRGTRELG